MTNLDQSLTSNEETQNGFQIKFKITSECIIFHSGTFALMSDMQKAFDQVKLEGIDHDFLSFFSAMVDELEKLFPGYYIIGEQSAGLCDIKIASESHNPNKVKVVGKVDLKKIEGGNKKYFPTLDEDQKLAEIEDNASSMSAYDLEEGEFFQPGQICPDIDFSSIDEDSSAYLFQKGGVRSPEQ